MFIGGRTHAVISAYATCTPAIALGYSIKSKGIAHDLGLSEKLVVDTKKRAFNSELLGAFQFADNNQAKIKTHVEHVIPGYVQQIEQLKQEIAVLQLSQ